MRKDDADWEFFKDGWELDLRWFPEEKEPGYGSYSITGYHQISELIVAKVCVSYTEMDRGPSLRGGYFRFSVAIKNKEATTHLPIDSRYLDSGKAWNKVTPEELAAMRREIEAFIKIYKDRPRVARPPLPRSTVELA